MTRSDSELIRVRSSVVLAHRANDAAPADIQRAYLRFSWARRKAPGRLLLVRWLLAGVAIGVGVASAASLAPRLGTRSAAPIESAKFVDEIVKQAKVRVAARGGVAGEEPSFADAIPAPSAQPPAASPAASAGYTPRVAVQRAAASPSRALTTSASDWERAAAALRSGDISAAEAALANLEKSDNVLDRQAAELAQAQLLVRRGRAAEAASTLQRLVREGGSAVIRSQAASTLRTLGN